MRACVVGQDEEPARERGHAGVDIQKLSKLARFPKSTLRMGDALLDLVPSPRSFRSAFPDRSD